MKKHLEQARLISNAYYRLENLIIQREEITEINRHYDNEKIFTEQDINNLLIVINEKIRLQDLYIETLIKGEQKNEN